MKDARDEIASRHALAVAHAIDRWAGSLDSLDSSALDDAVAKLREEIARELEQAAGRAVMLAVTDTLKEARTDRRLDASEGAEVNFAKAPYEAAIQAFRERATVTKELFETLLWEGRRRAFTVADAMSLDAVEVVRSQLEAALVEGNDLRGFVKRVRAAYETRGWTGAEPYNLETIFRTNVMGAYGDARFESVTRPEVMLRRPYLMYVATLDDRTRETHAAAHGKIMRADDPRWKEVHPPNGYNCFLPGSPIASRDVVGASRALYRGQAVEVRTDGGGSLRVTAGHPVLSARGMVRADSLDVGDHVLGFVVRVDDEQAPPAIEQVLEALSYGRPLERAEVRPVDFHGEAACFVGQVDVVGSYGQLADEAREPSEQLALEPPDALRAVGEPGSRVSDLRGVAPGGPAFSGPRAGALANNVDAPGRPFEALGLRSSARHDTDLAETSADGWTAHAEQLRQAVDGLAVEVALHKIVHVERFSFHGFVHDLETKSGLVLSGGIVASNCRCTLRSLRLDDAMERDGGAIAYARDPSNGALPDAYEIVDGYDPVWDDLPDDGFSTALAAREPADFGSLYFERPVLLYDPDQPRDEGGRWTDAGGGGGSSARDAVGARGALRRAPRADGAGGATRPKAGYVDKGDDGPPVWEGNELPEPGDRSFRSADDLREVTRERERGLMPHNPDAKLHDNTRDIIERSEHDEHLAWRLEHARSPSWADPPDLVEKLDSMAKSLGIEPTRVKRQSNEGPLRDAIAKMPAIAEAVDLVGKVTMRPSIDVSSTLVIHSWDGVHMPIGAHDPDTGTVSVSTHELESSWENRADGFNVAQIYARNREEHDGLIVAHEVGHALYDEIARHGARDFNNGERDEVLAGPKLQFRRAARARDAISDATQRSFGGHSISPYSVVTQRSSEFFAEAFALYALNPRTMYWRFPHAYDAVALGLAALGKDITKR